MRRQAEVPKLVALAAMVVAAATCTPPPRPRPMVSARAPTGPTAVALPFALTLGTPFEVPGAVGLHSFVFGTVGDRVLIVGGRTSGLHGFSPDPDADNFSSAGVNADMWVVDLAMRQAWRRSLAFLSADLGDPLMSTNAQAAQDGTRLLVVGGYGLDRSHGNPTSGRQTTFPTLTVVDLPRTMAMVVAGPNGGDLSTAVGQIRNERFRVTGGALMGAAGKFFLLFGQAFEGQYTPALRVTTSFTQSYTDSVRIFTLNGATPADTTPTWLPGLPATPILDHDHFHRRDFSATATIAPSGAPRLTVFGGAFRSGMARAHLSAVHVDHLTQAPALVVDDFKQALSQYACPTVTIVGGAAGGDAFTVFFGGLSEYRYSAAEHRLVPNEAMTDHGLDPLGFIDAVSGIASRSSGARQGFVLPATLPGLLGTSAVFIPRPGFDGGVIPLDRLTTPTIVGYIFGGIAASALHAGAEGTRASSLFIPVIVAPTSSSAAPMPAIPAF